MQTTTLLSVEDAAPPSAGEADKRDTAAELTVAIRGADEMTEQSVTTAPIVSASLVQSRFRASPVRVFLKRELFWIILAFAKTKASDVKALVRPAGVSWLRYLQELDFWGIPPPKGVPTSMNTEQRAQLLEDCDVLASALAASLAHVRPGMNKLLLPTNVELCVPQFSPGVLQVADWMQERLLQLQSEERKKTSPNGGVAAVKPATAAAAEGAVPPADGAGAAAVSPAAATMSIAAPPAAEAPTLPAPSQWMSQLLFDHLPPHVRATGSYNHLATICSRLHGDGWYMPALREAAIESILRTCSIVLATRALTGKMGACVMSAIQAPLKEVGLAPFADYTGAACSMHSEGQIKGAGGTACMTTVPCWQFSRTGETRLWWLGRCLSASDELMEQCNPVPTGDKTNVDYYWAQLELRPFVQGTGDKATAVK